MESKPHNVHEEPDDAHRVTLAIFPVSQYLGDPAIQKTVAAALAKPRGLTSADTQALHHFHPLSTEEFRQKRDSDVYLLFGTQGKLIRTHAVVTNGISRTNPPPEGYLCDSCHSKGWLKKDFQDSRLDGANIAVWLCPDCSRLGPGKRDVRF